MFLVCVNMGKQQVMLYMYAEIFLYTLTRLFFLKINFKGSSITTSPNKYYN